MALARRGGADQELKNILLHPYVPKETTSAVMGLADCALITLSDEALGLISPSKLHANLAMRLPIVYVGPAGSNVDDAIHAHGFGLSIRHSETAKLVKFLRNLRDDASLHMRLKDAARLAFDSAFNDAKTLPLYDQLLASLLPASSDRR